MVAIDAEASLPVAWRCNAYKPPEREVILPADTSYKPEPNSWLFNAASRVNNDTPHRSVKVAISTSDKPNVVCIANIDSHWMISKTE